MQKLEPYKYRMIAHGITPYDYDTIRARVENGVPWENAFSDMSVSYQKLADTALADDFEVSGGHFIVRAAVCMHFAQFLLWDREADKQEMQNTMRSIYYSGHEYYFPSSDRVWSEKGRSGIFAIMREVPISEKSVAVIIPDFDGSKEEMHFLTEYFINRGISTCVIDPPGVGETRARLKASPKFETEGAKLIDMLYRREYDSIGIFGIGLGGYYAARLAASDNRIDCCALLGALYDLKDIDEKSQEIKDGLMYATGQSNWSEAREYLMKFDMSDHHEKSNVALLVVHGANDDLAPLSDGEMYYSEATGKKAMIVEEDGNRACANLSWTIYPRIADWMSDYL